jgi:hypothetical protein
MMKLSSCGFTLLGVAVEEGAASAGAGCDPVPLESPAVACAASLPEARSPDRRNRIARKILNFMEKPAAAIP